MFTAQVTLFSLVGENCIPLKFFTLFRYQPVPIVCLLWSGMALWSQFDKVIEFEGTRNNNQECLENAKMGDSLRSVYVEVLRLTQQLERCWIYSSSHRSLHMTLGISENIIEGW